ncbi:unnamed protein product [Candidula unifasciata]|uniref:Uncharacterized protein n=1 Tax=Candidula unifasciata TaxID=100452 RepID=A0A8S3ZNG9_9EUPU|nr:unnamed protein product [Candidula unifasciata]
MAEGKCTQKPVTWPDRSEYTDKYILPSLTPAKPDPWSGQKHTDQSGRPRTPNDPYTVLNEQQLKNLKKDASPFFMYENVPGGTGSKRCPTVLPAPIDRFAYDTSQYLFRDTPPRSHPHCWIGDQWTREAPGQHNTSRLGSSLSWGLSKTGERTISHFHKEDVYRYLNIDVYKRPPTNMPAFVAMKYGRPTDGYYQQRNPNFNTWFGSTHKLNETNILTHIHPKTVAECQQFRELQQNYGRHLASKWPEISEYSDRYLLRTKEEIQADKMEARKQFHREKRRQEADALLQAQAQQLETAPQVQPVAA